MYDMKSDLLFKNQFRIPSTRLKGWDYASSGSYFITICTKYFVKYFGDIQDGKMYLSDIGYTVERAWKNIPNQFKNVFIDEFIVMPNHIHGILIINNRRDADSSRLSSNDADSSRLSSYDADSSRLSHASTGGITKNHNPMLNQGSISAIVRSYKACVSKIIHEQNPEFQWQSRFYDEIIKNEGMYENIKDYIVNNPIKWSQTRRDAD